MAKKVIFSEEPLSVSAGLLSEKGKTKLQTKTAAQAKATYSFPWWASNEPTEIFWGQANEPVQIVPPAKYLESAKQATGREVLEQELTDPQALLEEFQERVGIVTGEKLKSKIFSSQKKQAV